MLKTFLLTCISTFSSCLLSYTFESLEDFSDFDNKPVVALWRGTYFSPTYFQSDQDQNRYRNAHGLKVPIYCAASHRQENVSFLETLTQESIQRLDASALGIQKHFKTLEESAPFTLDRTPFKNKRHAFQQRYSNSTKFINALGLPALSTHYRKCTPLIKDLPKGNPLLSFSTDPSHAGSYGYGLKDYGSLEKFSQLYNDQGKRKQSYLGYLHGILLTDEVAKHSMPYDVVAHHSASHIKVATYSSRNILAEHEVSFVAKIPGESVTFTLPLELPDFSQPYPGEYREQFGLSKKKYDNIRACITDTQTSEEKKQQRVEKMLKELIKPNREDDGLVYKNTLFHRAHTLLEETYSSLDNHIEGVIGLDGYVHQKT